VSFYTLNFDQSKLINPDGVVTATTNEPGGMAT
jgi:hypothetical protein